MASVSDDRSQWYYQMQLLTFLSGICIHLQTVLYLRDIVYLFAYLRTMLPEWVDGMVSIALLL